MIDISFVANSAWNLVNFRLPIMRRFLKERFDVVAVASKDRFSDTLASDFELIMLRKLVRRSRNPLKELLALGEVIWIYARNPADLFFQFTPKMNIYGSISAAITGRCCVSTVSGLGYAFTGGRLLSLVLKLLYKIAFSFNERVIFQNRDDERFFLLEGMVSHLKSTVVPGSGVNVDEFCPCPADEGEKKVFLLVARMLWDKGIEEFVEAAGVVKSVWSNAEFWMLGPVDEGNPAAISPKTISDWQERGVVRWFGEKDDIKPIVAKSSVAVLPSYYREGIPRALLEAMAMGKPIITTDAIGCSETVENGVNGFIVPVRDSYALANAMIKFLSLSERVKKVMGLMSRKKAVREFSENIVVERYLAIARQLLRMGGIQDKNSREGYEEAGSIR